jgi:hypothetical protein
LVAVAEGIGETVTGVAVPYWRTPPPPPPAFSR